LIDSGLASRVCTEASGPYYPFSSASCISSSLARLAKASRGWKTSWWSNASENSRLEHLFQGGEVTVGLAHLASDAVQEALKAWQ